MSLFVRLKKYKNKTKSSYGKLYAETVYTGEVHTRDIAKAVSENTTFRPGEVKGLIDEIVAEMKRQLQDSNIVVIDGLGRFRLMVESEGVEKKEDFNIQTSIKRIVCKYLPAGRRDAEETGNKQNGRIKRNFCDGAKVRMWPGKD